jgi:hypothetical protein
MTLTAEEQYQHKLASARKYGTKKRQQDPASVKRASAEWYERNIETARPNNTERNRLWRSRQGESYDEYQRQAKRKARLDPAKRLAGNLRARIYGALKGRSREPHLGELIGCSIPELMRHLERQFSTGMSWENYGRWHVDHRRPLDSFDLNDPRQVLEAMNFRNLQPLWARGPGGNLSKGARVA